MRFLSRNFRRAKNFIDPNGLNFVSILMKKAFLQMNDEQKRHSHLHKGKLEMWKSCGYLEFFLLCACDIEKKINFISSIQRDSTGKWLWKKLFGKLFTSWNVKGRKLKSMWNFQERKVKSKLRLCVISMETCHLFSVHSLKLCRETQKIVMEMRYSALPLPFLCAPSFYYLFIYKKKSVEKSKKKL